MRNFIVIIAIAMITPLFNSCIFDAQKAEKPPGGGTPPAAFKDLTMRDDVLFNLRLGYNTGNIDEYNKLLDDNFTFFFSDTDITAGNVNVANWDRASEIAATNNLFGFGELPPGQAPVSDINLSITWNETGDDWQPVSPPDPVQYPGETWYTQNVDYFLDVVAGGTTYTSGNPIKASFTIRQATVNGETIWRIVSWRDDI